ncbi:hypothetical protein A5N15_08930 [Rothia kristinae]|uniref:Uncharacterized protein n=1 Tax=Rothia kristinae TaxID=37923 RepID=A0A657IU45_9MICC|nr:hypothetical protein A5N15_08930 [Rothia kristinae]
MIRACTTSRISWGPTCRIRAPRLGVEGHPPFGLQADESLAHRGAGDLQLRGDLAFGDQLPAFELVLEDAGLDVLVHQVRRGGPGGARGSGLGVHGSLPGVDRPDEAW